MKILAGDIGGTKTLLQIAEISDDHIGVVHEQRFDSQTYDSFNAVLAQFLQNNDCVSNHGIGAACIGVAGPVRETDATVTNLPWVLNADDIASRSEITNVTLINDFQAIGYGIETLSSADLLQLHAGSADEHGTRAVIGAGTGLGEGILIWSGDRYHVLASEGGHVDFGPADQQQFELLSFLRQNYRHVSYEMLCSGPGLANIYAYLREKTPHQEPADFRQSLVNSDPAASISKAALDNSNPVAVAALKLFARIYGAQAGNLALTSMATGGIYLAGGIAPRISHFLQQADFMSAFCNKGKMKNLMQQFPVNVILNPHVGLQGAALVASRISHH